MTATLKQKIMGEKPTTEQEAAIFYEGTEYVLRAAPGSGKTWTSCRRFIWRTATWPHAAGGLALLSFTNVAIQEFKKAAAKIGHADSMDNPNFVGTSDAFIDRFILGPFGHHLTNGKRPRLALGKRAGDDENKGLLHWEKSSAGHWMPIGAWDIAPILEETGVTFRNGRQELPSKAGDVVQKFIESGRYTHAHRGLFAVSLLESRPQLARALARRFPEIIVDEAQDCGGWTVKILRILRHNGSRISLVGDPDQCIYGFSQADHNLMAKLRAEWTLQELPLSKSFRCNDRIAKAGRRLGTNANFVGNGDAGSDARDAFIVRENKDDFSDAVSFLNAQIKKAGLHGDNASILCRGHDQLQKLSGFPLFRKLKGLTSDLAEATFARDHEGNLARAYQLFEAFMRNVSSDETYWRTIDEDPEGAAARACRIELWTFVKRPSQLPPLTLPATEWLEAARKNLDGLQDRLGLPTNIKFGQKIKKTGLESDEEGQPLMVARSHTTGIRHQTIHQVKGESIDAVLVVGAAKYWSEAAKAASAGAPVEATRLGYVAATRARHLLVVALPASHYDSYHETWKSWGFRPSAANAHPTQKALA